MLLSCSIVFSALWQDQRFYVFVCLIFTLWSTGTVESIWGQVLFFLLTLGLVLWRGLGNFYLKIPENFMDLIFLNRFWFVHICQYSQFASFITWLTTSSVTTYPTLAALLHFINFCFDIIGSYGIILRYY